MDSQKALLRYLAEFADDLQAEGRYTFSRLEVVAALQLSPPMLQRSAMRLTAKSRLATPTRGFYVIVPIEYRVAGAPPPAWFIDDLMRHLGRSYYVGVLSAAGIHGAAHQQPQEFQVIVQAARRPMRVGRARLRFLGKRRVDATIVSEVSTVTGTMRVSTPEATALDLLRYASAAGGLDNVATVLTELAERLDPVRLVKAAEADSELAFAQRLGYLLEHVGAARQAGKLAKMVAGQNPREVLLRPGRPRKGSVIDRRWRVVVNAQVEADL